MCAVGRRRENKPIMQQEQNRMIQDKRICISLLLQIFNTSHYDRK